MITLTKEWLLKTIAELEEERDATPGAVNEDAANALAAMKLALASLEAEAVAFRSKLKPSSAIGSEHWDYTEHRQPDAFELRNCIIERLYTAPPAPVSVPEPIKRNDADGWWMYKGRRVGGGCAEWYNLALDDCRAAMLQGADGNSPVIPDGWVMVPVEPTYQMCEAMGLPWESPRFPERYKAMIAAAPRQEVK
ncbi:TPA: hypothetical protein N2R18_002324 [Enterobacter hormaechei]|nr:hypothetical protein [Enterobacter hormaechei]HED3211657.1 hypothetical protein [Enterobacter hormaechei subsp. xiangfangensis]HED3280769.1 hypothetical protein [Enterobacter hormaechei subsp. xiangfangensis]HED4105790.1 hypothetical protein [Enterobacter hormaechei subsp. xiangfangensis]HED4126955.1 hypothetical protein [Enterobacter hormaechei subsp. xiangfangensis]